MSNGMDASYPLLAYRLNTKPVCECIACAYLSLSLRIAGTSGSTYLYPARLRMQLSGIGPMAVRLLHNL